jgi:hypothetical protein
MPFDIKAARAAGATDDQISQYLDKYIDVKGATTAGASLDDIAGYVNNNPKPVQASQPSQPQPEQKPIVPAMFGAPSYAQASPQDYKTVSPVLNAITKIPSDVALGAINAPFHPVQTGKGIALGIASQYPNMAPQYVQPGPVQNGYVSPEAVSNQSQDISDIAKTPQEKRGVTIGQMMATYGSPEVAPIAGAAKQGAKDAALGTGESMMNMANRIANKNIGISKAGQEAGADLSNLGKYGLFGSAQKNVDNAKSQIQTAASGLKAALEKSSNDPDNYVNISGVLAKAKEKIVNGNMSQVEKSQLASTFDNVAKKIETPYLDEEGLPKDQNLLEAQLLKRYVGKYGDWLANPGQGARPSPDASQESQVYNTIYDVLKNELQDKGGPDVAKYNKTMSDLIPIEKDASKRALVKQRNNVIDFSDYLGGLSIAASASHGNFIPAAVVGANMATKSPNVARILYNTGKKLSDIGK